MKKILLAGAGLAALVAQCSTGHATGFYVVCTIITDDAPHDMLKYKFNAKNVQYEEVAFFKNGVEIVHSTPYWRVANNDDNHTVSLWSQQDPGLALEYYGENGPPGGGATLWFNNVRVGAGHCHSESLTIDHTPVPIFSNGKEIWLTVNLGDRDITMLLDTGATISSVPIDIADSLIATGQAVEGPAKNMTMADGTNRTVRTIFVNTLAIGANKRYNVPITVMPNGSDALLCLPVLNAIGKFTIDNDRQLLIFG
jgi:clan AA aspartic protease (TIGR02281 family)